MEDRTLKERVRRRGIESQGAEERVEDSRPRGEGEAQRERKRVNGGS